VDVPLEDIWFQLLSSQINSVQSVSACCTEEALVGPIHATFEDEASEVQWRALSALRSLVQQTFGALVSISSTRAVSFPQLFKRLVDPANYSHSETGMPYTEFRTILTGMMEFY
jgi:vacuolar protein sorting-associated protein 8